MKRSRKWLAGSVAVVVLFYVVPMLGGDVKKPPAQAEGSQKPAEKQPPTTQPGQGEMEDMMAKYKELAAPGPEHKLLERLVGKWATSTKMWMDPSAPPTESKGKMEAKAIMGGRYILSKFESVMMNEPFEGMAIDGYDKYNKKYVSFWVDNFGTGFYTTTGTADAAGKVFTYEGKWDDPMMDRKGKPVKMVVKCVSDDKFVMEMYDEVGTPKEFKVMEIEYTRVK